MNSGSGEAGVQGRILQGIGGFYYVDTPAGLIECKLRGKFRNDGIKPVAGDFCLITDGDGRAQNIITEILPRKNSLLRPPLANLDVLYFVVSIQSPQPNLSVLDRLLAIAHYKSIPAALVLTKTDLGDGKAIQAIYATVPGLAVFLIDYGEKAEIDSLRAHMHGKVSAFCGNSGVGKSTLLNRFFPDLTLTTAAISQKLGRGKHTTRDVCLYPLPEGGFVADTPGFSSLEFQRFEQIAPEDVADCFPEFAPYLGKCQFRDCTHTVEKGCQILVARNEGKIAPSRHLGYVSMREEAKEMEKKRITGKR